MRGAMPRRAGRRDQRALIEIAQGGVVGQHDLASHDAGAGPQPELEGGHAVDQRARAQHLDDGAVGTPPPASPTYLTAVEVAADYAKKVGTSDIEITDATKGLILRDSVTNERIRLTIADGVITLTNLGTP
jgi:hypothetical protein